MALANVIMELTNQLTKQEVEEIPNLQNGSYFLFEQRLIFNLFLHIVDLDITQCIIMHKKGILNVLV